MRTKFSGILTLLLVFAVQLTFAQQKTVSGSVTDPSAIPLPGVDITVKGTSQGTQTDFDGKYTIEVSSDDVLIFNYLGFKKVEVRVGNKTTINASLEPDAELLDDVVITAYGGILKDSEVVSAVSTVRSESIEQIPIASVDQILQGQVAGANIRTNSGQPGQAATTIIRGRSSLSGNTQPLYVIDGMPVNEDNFRAINPNDIESMNVLKDAAGSAIYGNRGAGGVIIVTTKKAKRNSGLLVRYRALFGQSTNVESNVRMMNSSQLLTWRRDQLPGTQFGSNLSDGQIAAIAGQANTNWAKILFQNGKTESHELNITQGNENMSSFTSVQYFEQEGTTLRSKTRRFSVRNNIEGGNDKISYGTNVALAYSSNDFVVDAVRGNNTGGQLDNPFIVPFIGLPFLNPFNPDGSINIVGSQQSGALNPDGSLSVSGANGFLNTPFLAMNTAALNTDREDELRMLVGGNLTYRLNEKVSIGGTANMDYIGVHALQIDAPGSIRGALRPNQQAAADFNGGSQFEAFRRDFSFNTNANIRYTDFLDEDKKHRLSAALFTEYFYRNFQSAGFRAFGLNPKFPGSSAGFVDPNTAVVDGNGNETFPFIPNVFSSQVDTALLSYFGNATWDYDGRFGADVTVRRDGTSRFQSDYRWGTFYSVAGRWNIDREAFMEDVEWVSALKTRLSYGETGNQSIAGFFPGFQTFAGGPGYQNNNQLSPQGLSDEEVQWETTSQVNFGIDFGLWNNRLTGALDVYKKETSDLFFGRNISTSGTGFSNTQTNVGTMTNTGVELQIAYDILRKSATNDWSVNVFFNGAYNDNEVVSLDNDTGFVEGAGRTRLQEGLPAFTYFMQEWAGVNPADGRALYYTADGELTTVYNRAANGVYTGKQFDPVWTGGFGLNASWKEWSLNSLWSFQYDAWRVNGTYAITEDAGIAGFSNMNTSLLDAWQQPGDITGVPSLAFGGLRFQDGTRYLEDASFLRLRNINLRYTVNKQTLDRIGFINGLSVFVQGTNLLTFTKWRGFDPESSIVSDFFSYPLPKQVTAGIDVTF